MSNLTNPLSRRTILRGAALVSASAAVTACGDDPAPAGPNPDIEPLNALLRAEFSAIKAYEAGGMVLMDRLTTPMGDPNAGYAAPLLTIAANWKAQHQAHADAITARITAIGGTPIASASVTFSAPNGFTQTVGSVLILACNAEKNAAVAYNNTVAMLSTTESRFLAGNIEGDETQHFMVLYGLIKGLVAPAVATLLSNINEVVPRAFVANSAGSTSSLEALADFTYA